MKAVILAAGEGNRLKPITSTRPKPMIPLAGKPLLEHTILSLKDAGIDEVLLIVGYKKEIIKEYFGNGIDKFNIKIEYITQEEYLGTAHAANYAKEFAKNEPFMLMYGDILVDPIVYKEVLDKFRNSGAEGLISLIEVKNPEVFGIISLDSNDFVEKITEKPPPELGLGNLANAGIFLFDPLIFEAIEKTEKSIRDEYEFTDSMEILINQLNGKIIGYTIKNYYWSDVGLPWQLLEANEFLSKRLKHDILGIVEKNVQINGDVYIGKGTIIKSGSYIEGPCYIGSDTSIGPDAYLGAFTSIGNRCHIGDSKTSNSIIFNETDIPHSNYVVDSVICEKVVLGSGTKISNIRSDDKSIMVMIKDKQIDSGRKKLGAFIGANVKIGINTIINCGKKIGENSIIGDHSNITEDVPPNTNYS
jgi:bifunctional UDP-N-acetylglucosamine pyrophosphorylase/glucosamine-1-phosphate N-acetyltransferase